MPRIDESNWTPERAKGFEPIHRTPVSPIIGKPASEPIFPTYPRFYVTSLPLAVTYQPDALRQFYRGGVPQSRIMPVAGG